MAPNGNAPLGTEGADTAGTAPVRRRKAARYIVPVTVAGVAAATIGLVPALANSGDPDLPKITAQQLIEKIAASDTQQLSGTVKISTDLGLPSLDGLAGSFGGAKGGAGGGSSADPASRLTELASGTHTMRVAADGPDRQRISLLNDAAEYSVIHNGDDVWAYDSASNEAFHAKAPEGRDQAAPQGRDQAVPEGRDQAAPQGRDQVAPQGRDQVAPQGRDQVAPHGRDQALPKDMPTTPKAFAEQALKFAEKDTSVTVGGTAKVAGRDAYQLVIKPKQTGSTVGEIRVAVDSLTGTPLKFTLNSSSGGKPVVDAGFTKVDFAKPAADTFKFSPPKGAKVTEADDLKAQEGRQGKGGKEFGGALGKDLEKQFGKGGAGKGDAKVIGEGWTSVLHFSGDAGKKAPGAGQQKDELPADAQKLMDSLGDKVSGKFGEGRVFSTRLVNALMTDDGQVYVGAVTKDALVKAANEAK